MSEQTTPCRATALVHEAYLRLIDQESFQTQHRAHFVAMAARLMGEIPVDYARQRRAAKRGYTCKITLDEAIGLYQKREFDLPGFGSHPGKVDPL